MRARPAAIVAIFARGTFVGDGLLERLDLDETASVPYALDSGTTIAVDVKTEERPSRVVAIQRGTLTVERAGIQRTRYAIAAGRRAPKRIYLRHTKARGYTVRELPPNSIDRGEAWLVPLAITPATESELEERQPRRRTIALADSRAGDLAEYLPGSTELPADVAVKLKAAIAMRLELTKIEDALASDRLHLSDVQTRAYEIRSSIQAIERVATAGELRAKLVKDLRDTTTKTDELTKKIEAANQAAAALRAKLGDTVRELVLDERKP